MTRVLILVFGLLFAGHAAGGAEKVRVRVGEHPGFDRLVFDWAAPVGVKLEEGSDQATLRFDRVAELDLRRLRRDPPPGVRSLTPQTETKSTTVVIGLAPGSRLRLLESGAATVLDILRPETPLDAPPARRDGTLGAAIPPQEIRSPLPKAVPSEEKPQGTAAQKAASPSGPQKKAAAKIPEKAPEKPPTAAVRTAVPAPGNTVVSSPLTPPAPAKADSRPPETGAPRKATAPLSLLNPPPTENPDEAALPATAPKAPPEVKAPPAVPVVPVIREPKAQKSAPKSKGPKSKGPQKAKPPNAAGRAKAPSKTTPRIIVPSFDIEKVAPDKTSAPGTTDASGTSSSAETAPPRLLVLADQRSAHINASGHNLIEGMPQTMNNLRFQWDAEVGLAAFRRGANIWLVFDAEASGNVTSGMEELAPELVPIDQFRAPGATIIRMAAPPIVNPVITRDGATWVVALWPRPPRAESPVEIEIEGEVSPKGLYLAMKGPGPLIQFHDPASGARMLVIPTREEGQGLKLPLGYSQFEALASFQGLALELTDENTQVTATGTGIRITNPDGLVLSHGSSLAMLQTNQYRPAIGPRLFDLESWRREDEGGYFKVRQKLQSALADVDPQRAAYARLELARFYFAHGFTNEAAGLLDVAKESEYALPLDPETRLIRGAAAFLSGNYGAAAIDLFDQTLTGEAEAELWNAAMAWISFDWDVATRKFSDHEFLIAAYPHRLRTRLRLMAAESALGVHDIDTASRFLDAARADDPTPNEEAEIAVIMGDRHLRQDEEGKAIELWKAVVQYGRHQRSATRARIALLDVAVDKQTISAEDAIAELERLRFAWRGDNIELAMLQRLGDLYASQGRYRDSLSAFREATTTVPDSRLARDVAQRMGEVFYDVIGGSGGADLAPLSALALYEEFKELTPPDAEGDRLLMRLADRLIQVDLLPRAAELLTNLVKHRLSGDQKALVGARVADLHLLDEKPEQALAVLDLTEDGEKDTELDEGLKRRLVYLRARALARLARYEDALRAIGDDNNPQALRLRADLLWEQANWPAAAVVLSQLVPEQPREDRLLTDDESRNVVDLAVALTLAEDRAGLARLNDTYKDAMADGPDRETFALLTAGAGNIAERSIAQKLAEVAKAEDFLTRYRDQVQQAETQAN